MKEYAILTEAGSVVTIVTTSKPIDEIVVREGQRAVPIEQVPTSALIRYEYWGKRP